MITVTVIALGILFALLFLLFGFIGFLIGNHTAFSKPKKTTEGATELEKALIKEEENYNQGLANIIKFSDSDEDFNNDL